MGIVNVTPDSFSDGGRFIHHDRALAHARRMIAEGADILDIGGESTRPGAEPVSADEEMSRVLPLIRAIRVQSEISISVDTLKPVVARAAMEIGASVWNDVTALTGAPDSLAVAADLGCQVILMHMQGEPRTMQAAPDYANVADEVTAWLCIRAEAAMTAGVAREKIMLDPGIGFGKTLAQNLALIENLDRLVALGYPVVLGASRKRFIRAVDPSAESTDDRLGGSLAAALVGALKGAAVLRVHDVRETVQALKVWAALGSYPPAPATAL